MLDVRPGAPGISHDDMVRWMASWDTDQELPSPEPES